MLSQPGLTRLAFVFSAVLSLSACQPAAPSANTAKEATQSAVPALSDSERLPGGIGSSAIMPFASYEKPVTNLPFSAKADFFAGKALAHQPWVKAPTATTARDGLGPLYNARTCLACHINGGRGTVPADNNTPLFNAFLRLSLPGSDPVAGVIPEPVYGDQLQSQSTALSHQLRSSQNDLVRPDEVAPEAYVYLNWQTRWFTYPDGQQIELRWPEADIRNLGYGPLHEHTLFSLRVAPPIHGMGLLELIDQADIDALADEHDRNQDGISGRVNQVWDVEQHKTVPGRFGLKANRPTMAMVVAGAFANDVGISNPLFPAQPCTDSQTICLQQATGNDKQGNDEQGNDQQGTELPQKLLQLVINFNRNLAVPQRRDADHPDVLAGRSLFYQSGCAGCHQPSFVTGESSEFPHLSQQVIWPYSDLLLHDMGEELADQRPDYAAGGREWRTPPLWGLGLSQQVNGSTTLLHDGRARSVEEAIVWHGGEALGARQTFVNLPAEERKALIRFVQSL